MARPIRLLVALAFVTCRPVETTMTPSTEVQRQTEFGAEYLAAKDREKAGAVELARAEQAQAQAQEQLRAYDQREREAVEQVDRYAATIAAAQGIGSDCPVGAERLVEMHVYLRQFAAEPARDAAIEALERCRTTVARARKQELQRSQVATREAFARSVEQAFDEAYPHARGRMIAEVKAATLRVELRDWTEWRPRDCQRALDAWCATTPPFTSIELRGPHGTSRCRPGTTPEDQVAAQVRADGLVDPWVPAASGTSATPVAGDLRGDHEGRERLRGELDRTTQWVQASRAEYVFAGEDAEAVAEKLQGLDDGLDAQMERRSEFAERKYNKMMIASIPVNLGGGAFGILGVLSLTARGHIVDGTREFSSVTARDAALQRTTRNAILGYVVGVPLIVAGLTLVVISARGLTRVRHVRRLTFSASGIGFRF
jgi:hypothetical protein